MIIANPIYDAAFKYLLTNDLKVAKLFISNLINKKIKKLVPAPTQLVTGKKKVSEALSGENTMTVMHMDFAATIVESDGSETVIIIEMQKAKLLEDIMRFRKYLGMQYGNDEYRYMVAGKIVAKPIFPVYILEHKIGCKEEALLIERHIKNAITNEIVEYKNEFINGITHDALIIQVPAVANSIDHKYPKGQKVNKHLKELLNIFDQTHYSSDSKQLLNLDSSTLPKWLKPVADSLEKAGQLPEVREQMELEDDYYAQLEVIERRLAKNSKTIKMNLKELKKKDQTIEQKDQTIEQNTKDLEQKDQALEQKDQALDSALKVLMDGLNISKKEAKKRLNL